MRKKKKSDESGFNVWRSYSDMMAGILLLFVLIMCVTLFQAQKSYDEKTESQANYIAKLVASQTTIDEQTEQLQTQKDELAALTQTLAEQEAKLDEQAALLAAQEDTLAQQQDDLDEKTAQLTTQQKKIDNIIGVKADVVEALQKEFSDKNLNVDIDAQTGALILDANVMFEYDKAELTKEGEEALNTILPIYCKVLLKKEYRQYLAEIIIDGYTDPDGDYGYNLELSQKRSLSVAQFLLNIQNQFLGEKGQKYLQEYLTVNGHSMSNPVLDENGNIDKDASRRVEVKFRLKDDEMISELNKIMSSASN